MFCTILCKLLDELAEKTPRAQVKMSGWAVTCCATFCRAGPHCRLGRLLHDLSGLASPDGGLCAHISPVITPAALEACDWFWESDALL